MEQIKHTHVPVRGLKLHVAEIGTGSEAVVFLHGFPEIWYTWRYQMVAVAKAGYRAVAFDFRGYGLSDLPARPEDTKFIDTVHDVLPLLDFLGISKAFLVGTDYGSFTAFGVAALHPERVSGIITIGIPFMLPGPGSIQNDKLPGGFYITRWQEPGRAEADFGRVDVRTVIRNIYILFSRPEIPIARDDQEIMDIVDPSTPLPPWFSEEDLSEYASLYEKSGFKTPLQIPYRTLKDESGITDPKIAAPTLLIMGKKDYLMQFPGTEAYIESEMHKQIIPNMEIVYLPEGTHFVHEQMPEKVNELLLTFLSKHSA